MQQESNGATINEDASAAHLQLSSASSSRSAALPANNSSAPSLPSGAAAPLTSMREESIPPSSRRKQLRRSVKAHQKDAIVHRKSVRRLRKELYMIVGMYAVVEGVLFTAVAQSTALTCTDLWGPFGIAVWVTVGTVLAVLDKLRRMESHKQEVKNFEKRRNAVNDKLQELGFRGLAQALEPETTDSNPVTVRIPCVQMVLLLAFLVGFSTVIVISFWQKLCGTGHC